MIPSHSTSEAAGNRLASGRLPGPLALTLERVPVKTTSANNIAVATKAVIILRVVPAFLLLATMAIDLELAF